MNDSEQIELALQAIARMRSDLLRVEATLVAAKRKSAERSHDRLCGLSDLEEP